MSPHAACCLLRQGELSFGEGDLIYVSAKNDDGWWYVEKGMSSVLLHSSSFASYRVATRYDRQRALTDVWMAWAWVVTSAYILSIDNVSFV